MENDIRFLHPIVFGPVHSRRLGLSLGINLMPYDAKLCSFDCLYCECGFNDERKGQIPTREEVNEALEKKLIDLSAEKEYPDVITFSGNGEPTLHKDFEGVIDDTIELRDKFFPKVKVSVLSNATTLSKPNVVRALGKVDNNILKFDSAINDTMLVIDQPTQPSFSVNSLIEQLKQFDGKLIVQTIFVRGVHKGKYFDNTTESEVNAWLTAISAINPQQVMIYALDRPAPIETIEKVSLEELNVIAEKVKEIGFEVIVAG